MAGRTNERGTALLLNAQACEVLQIKRGTTFTVGFDANRDRLGIRLARENEGEGLTQCRLSIGWCLREFGFRLLNKELYRIEKNEPGADPPYIIPLNGRKTKF